MFQPLAFRGDQALMLVREPVQITDHRVECLRQGANRVLGAILEGDMLAIARGDALGRIRNSFQALGDALRDFGRDQQRAEGYGAGDACREQGVAAGQLLD